MDKESKVLDLYYFLQVRFFFTNWFKYIVHCFWTDFDSNDLCFVLIFLKICLFFSVYSIEQIDIVPTLASIFNFEIPVKSLGITFVDQLVPRKRKKDYLMPLVSLLKNSYQITGLLDVANGNFSFSLFFSEV